MDKGLPQGLGQGDDRRLDARVREEEERARQVRPGPRQEDHRGHGQNRADQGQEGGGLLQGPHAQGLWRQAGTEGEGQARRTQARTPQGRPGPRQEQDGYRRGKGQDSRTAPKGAAEEAEGEGSCRAGRQEVVEPRTGRGYIDEHGLVDIPHQLPLAARTEPVPCTLGPSVGGCRATRLPLPASHVVSCRFVVSMSHYLTTRVLLHAHSHTTDRSASRKRLVLPHRHQRSAHTCPRASAVWTTRHCACPGFSASRAPPSGCRSWCAVSSSSCPWSGGRRCSWGACSTCSYHVHHREGGPPCSSPHPSPWACVPASAIDRPCRCVGAGSRCCSLARWRRSSPRGPDAPRRIAASPARVSLTRSPG